SGWFLPAVVIALMIGFINFEKSHSFRNSVKAASLKVDKERKAAPEFELKDADGKTVRLSDYKGKVVLLYFWATWCGPCKVEIPWFIEFQKKYADKGLQVVGISIDDTPDKLEPYVKDMKMNYLVLQGLGHDDVQDAFGPILGIPVTVVISRDGKICATHAGLAGKDVFENEIQSLLQSSTAQHAETN